VVAAMFVVTWGWDGRPGIESETSMLAVTCGWDGRSVIEVVTGMLVVTCCWDGGKYAAGRLDGRCPKMVLPVSAAGKLATPARLGKSACAACGKCV
jgi:hypothetical protein